MIDAYQKTLAVNQKLVDADAANTDQLRNILLDYHKIDNALAMQGRHDDALAALQKGLAIGQKLVEADPGNSQWQMDYASLFHLFGQELNAEGKGDDALDALHRGIAILQTLVKSDPTDVGARRELAMQYAVVGFISSSRKKDFRTAIENWDQTIRLVPKFVPAWNARCWDHAKRWGQLEDALSDCTQALRLNPDDSSTLDSRGLVYVKLGQYDSAIADYDAALKLNPKLAGSLYGRGTAEAKKGRQR